MLADLFLLKQDGGLVKKDIKKPDLFSSGIISIGCRRWI